MKIRNIKAFVCASAFGLFAVAGLGACNTGTDPGDTNTERGDIKKEGSMVEGNNEDPMGEYRDTTDMESHYDQQEGAVHDGTGKKGGVERDDVNN